MKFFTKAWYQTMQNMGLGCLLEIDTEAEVFSETYYKRLYREVKEKWLAERAHICDLLQEPFEADKEMHNFDRMCRFQKQYYMLNLPADILEKIADIRVLVLNRCSKLVKEMIDAFADNCEKETVKVCEAYKEYEQAQFLEHQPKFLKNFVFHDSFVASLRKKGNDYHLVFEKAEQDEWLPQKLIFKNATIFQKEKQLAGACWLYEEVHKTESGYEICVLLDKNGLFDFSVKCDDVVLE